MEQTPHPTAGRDDAWLTPRLGMTFRTAVEPLSGMSARLGGRPAWLDRPQWPLSRFDGDQMMFVGQFPVPGEAERMAYVFITDDRDGGYPTWGAEDGENAVIIQPYGRVPSFIETIEAATGPTLWKRGPAWGDGPPVELHIDLAPLDAETEQALEADADSCEAWRSGAMPEYPNHGVVTPRDYVGGRPVFWQRHHPIPVPEDWRFFLQFDDFDGYDLPALNFAGGTGYIFLSHDGLEGRFYWDCI